MILYEEIYKKAVVLFDDPKITKAFEENKIAFCKFMYGYFNTASLYRPTVIGRIISDRTEPVGQMEIFKGNGLSNVFKLSITIPENSIIRYTLDGVEVSAKYNKEESSVELGEAPYSDEEFAVEYYFPGCINGDFSVIPADDLTLKDIEDKTKNILARLTVISWAEATQNMLVDIQGLLRDSDFKITPNAQTLSSKMKWVETLIKETNEYQTKLSWQVRYSKNARKTSRW